MDSLQRNYKLLGYAGLSVFIALALAVVFGATNIGPSPTQLFLYYSVSILCFLSGSFYGRKPSREMHLAPLSYLQAMPLPC